MGVFAAERAQVSRTGALFKSAAGACASGSSLTFVMGAFFIAGQVYEYAALISEGLTIRPTRTGRCST